MNQMIDSFDFFTVLSAVLKNLAVSICYNEKDTDTSLSFTKTHFLLLLAKCSEL